MEIKEYGGFLPLELPLLNEYFEDIYGEQDVLRLNCARTAFYCAAIDAKVKKIYMPYLNCRFSIDPIKRAGIDYEFYYLNDDLTPKDVQLKDNEMLLWINYYGNAAEEQIKRVCKNFKNLIIDNCHAFFSKPIHGVYNSYSTRKFFGVCDGAYLIKDNLKQFSLEQDSSYPHSEFLMKAIEEGTNNAYQGSLENENRVADRVLAMSKLTRRILKSIDYSTVQKIRRKNFIRLHEKLNVLNKFNVNLESETHIGYPLLIENEHLRQELVENKIYTPTLWRHVPDICGNKKIETWLSKYMIMIPIDQRYTPEDMDEIISIIKREISRL